MKKGKNHLSFDQPLEELFRREQGRKKTEKKVERLIDMQGRAYVGDIKERKKGEKYFRYRCTRYSKKSESCTSTFYVQHDMKMCDISAIAHTCSLRDGRIENQEGIRDEAEDDIIHSELDEEAEEQQEQDVHEEEKHSEPMQQRSNQKPRLDQSNESRQSRGSSRQRQKLYPGDHMKDKIVNVNALASMCGKCSKFFDPKYLLDHLNGCEGKIQEEKNEEQNEPQYPKSMDKYFQYIDAHPSLNCKVSLDCQLLTIAFLDPVIKEEVQKLKNEIRILTAIIESFKNLWSIIRPYENLGVLAAYEISNCQRANAHNLYMFAFQDIRKQIEKYKFHPTIAPFYELLQNSDSIHFDYTTFRKILLSQPIDNEIPLQAVVDRANYQHPSNQIEVFMRLTSNKKQAHKRKFSGTSDRKADGLNNFDDLQMNFNPIDFSIGSMKPLLDGIGLVQQSEIKSPSSFQLNPHSRSPISRGFGRNLFNSPKAQLNTSNMFGMQQQQQYDMIQNTQANISLAYTSQNATQYLAQQHLIYPVVPSNLSAVDEQKEESKIDGKQISQEGYRSNQGSKGKSLFRKSPPRKSGVADMQNQLPHQRAGNNTETIIGNQMAANNASLGKSPGKGSAVQSKTQSESSPAKTSPMKEALQKIQEQSKQSKLSEIGKSSKMQSPFQSPLNTVTMMLPNPDQHTAQSVHETPQKKTPGFESSSCHAQSVASGSERKKVTSSILIKRKCNLQESLSKLEQKSSHGKRRKTDADDSSELIMNTHSTGLGKNQINSFSPNIPSPSEYNYSCSQNVLKRFFISKQKPAYNPIKNPFTKKPFKNKSSKSLKSKSISQQNHPEKSKSKVSQGKAISPTNDEPSNKVTDSADAIAIDTAASAIANAIANVNANSANATNANAGTSGKAETTDKSGSGKAAIPEKKGKATRGTGKTIRAGGKPKQDQGKATDEKVGKKETIEKKPTESALPDPDSVAAAESKVKTRSALKEESKAAQPIRASARLTAMKETSLSANVVASTENSPKKKKATASRKKATESKKKVVSSGKKKKQEVIRSNYDAQSDLSEMVD